MQQGDKNLKPMILPPNHLQSLRRIVDEQKQQASPYKNRH